MQSNNNRWWPGTEGSSQAENFSLAISKLFLPNISRNDGHICMSPREERLKELKTLTVGPVLVHIELSTCSIPRRISRGGLGLGPRFSYLPYTAFDTPVVKLPYHSPGISILIKRAQLKCTLMRTFLSFRSSIIGPKLQCLACKGKCQSRSANFSPMINWQTYYIISSQPPIQIFLTPPSRLVHSSSPSKNTFL